MSGFDDHRIVIIYNLDTILPVKVSSIAQLIRQMGTVGWTLTRQFLYPVFCAVIIFALLLTSLIAVMLGSRASANDPIDHVLEFEDIQPGTPVLSAYLCRMSSASTYGEDHACVITPENPLIKRIQVTSDGVIIESVMFFLNDLALGYIILRWGKPDSILVRQNFFVARWQSGIYARGRISNDFSYHAPVQILSLISS